MFWGLARTEILDGRLDACQEGLLVQPGKLVRHLGGISPQRVAETFQDRWP